MNTNWKPGDVAIATVEGEPNVRVLFRVGEGGEDWAYSSDSRRSHGYSCSNVNEGLVVDPRPLVVIDPEDRKTFADALTKWTRTTFGYSATPGDLDNFAAALREFANPTPPRPDEPTGLGAVVEDESEVEFIHLGSGLWVYGTTDGPSEGFRYDEITAVRVLSDGVTTDA